MIARRLRELIPPRLLNGRWIVVLDCYLDDSGKDPQSPITTLAGYIARDTGWSAYEHEVERWFSEYSVNILHAKELHGTDGDFGAVRSIPEMVNAVTRYQNGRAVTEAQA